MLRPFARAKDDRPQTPRSARTIARIVEAAGRLFSRDGTHAATMNDVAREAGVSKGLLHYHFHSKEHLLIEAQRAILRQIHRRFQDRARAGDRGLPRALEALDALWAALLDLQSQTPFMVETFALANQPGPVQESYRGFADEGLALLEDGIRAVLAEDLAHLPLPPARLAFLVRTALCGLVVELSQARSEADLARVDAAYQDLRAFLGRALLAPAVGG